MSTEFADERFANFDELSPEEMARLICEENIAAIEAVKASTGELAAATKAVADAFESGACILYVGAGTSARIAAADAAEMPPTFGIEPHRFSALVAGNALFRAAEGAEDDAGQARVDLEQRISELGEGRHVVIGISASGNTPYVVTAVEHAKQLGLKTVGIANNKGSALLRAADLAVLLDTGPEVIAGSTRMKAGTAQKVALNIVSTGAMALCGRVTGNRMTSMATTNDKLRRRAVEMVMQLKGMSESEAVSKLERAAWNLPAALAEGE